jgi:hypothetical protein
MSIADAAKAEIKEQSVFACRVVPCRITRQFDKCVVVKLAEVPQDNGDALEIHGNFSREGLLQMVDWLDAQPMPVNLPSPDVIRADAKYQWAVVMADGSTIQQYDPEDMQVKTMADVALPLVREFWLIPHTRLGPDALPWFGCIPGEAFVRRDHATGEETILCWPGTDQPLPVPAEPFEWHYYRTPSITFHLGAMQGTFPVHLVHKLGWRVGPLGDPSTMVLELFVEEDGSWQIGKQEPIDDPRWH